MNASAVRGVFPRYGTPPCLRPGVAPDDLALIARDSAVDYARGHVARAVARWGFGCALDRCERVAVELVTRAVKTTGKRGPVPRDIELRNKPLPMLVGVRVCLLDAHVLVEVWDSDDASPLPNDGEFLDEHLAVVNEISRWNWYPSTPGAGKVIWAKVALVAKRTAGSFNIPEPAEPINPMRDLDVLKKVLDGLHSLDFVGVRGDL